MSLRCALLAALLVGALSPTIFAAERIPEPGAAPAATVPEMVKQGRELFQQRHYREALAEFSRAVNAQPTNRETRFLRGLAAYWARQPQQALEDWNLLLDTCKRGTAEEWDLQRHRAMAFSACGALDAADLVVARLYELRQKVKLKQAAEASGFVREHFYTNSLRAGVWEVFDERGEAQDLWSCPAVRADDGEDLPRKLLAVQLVNLPGGGPGYCLNEEGPGYLRVYKYWVKRPEYAEVRELLLQALAGKLQPVDSKKAENAGRFALAAPGAQPAAATAAEVSQARRDQATAAALQGLKLPAGANRILIVTMRLRDVDFDVAGTTRLSLTDPELAEQQLTRLASAAPLAREDAAELVEAIRKAKPEEVQAAFAQIVKLAKRKPYLDFALLTAANTRGHDVPAEFLEQTLASADATVRQTGAVILARQGDARGIKLLFGDLEHADTLGTFLLASSLEDCLLGAPQTPGSNAQDENAWSAWRKDALRWWQTHGARVKFFPAVPPAVGCWKIPADTGAGQ